MLRNFSFSFCVSEENIAAAGVANARVHPHIASKPHHSSQITASTATKWPARFSEENTTKPQQLEKFKMQSPTTSKQQVAFFQYDSEWKHAGAFKDHDEDSRLSGNFFPQQHRAASARQELNFPRPPTNQHADAGGGRALALG